MTGKLGGHAGPVMTVLLKETSKESLVFTGSRDHYVKVRPALLLSSFAAASIGSIACKVLSHGRQPEVSGFPI